MSIVNYGSDSDSETDSETDVVSKRRKTDHGKLHIDETKELPVNNSAKQLAKHLKRKRKKGGPWGGYSDDEEQEANVQPEFESEETPSFEEQAQEEHITTQFVGSQKFDYLGRTYMFTPNVSTPTKYFTPKKVIYTITAHKQGINKIALFPKSGHLLLTCGNDSLIKLWSADSRELLRIFMGHNSSVKDVVFNSDGTKFISCGYDKVVNLWNTESGEILHTFKVNSIPNTLLFFGDEFLIGLTNNKIEHYNLQGVLLQIYDHHQGGINSLTHISSNTFMSTSDDKTVRIWNYGINIPIKTISSHLQHAMPSAVLHPLANYIALQSMDNSIKVIHSSDKYKYKKSKLFTGHHCSGYGIEIAISPDGRILMSGDSKGCVYFWDWQTGKLVNKVKCNSKMIKCVVMHPKLKSRVFVGGDSGIVYVLD